MKLQSHSFCRIGVSLGTAVLLLFVLFSSFNPPILAAPSGSNPQIIVNEFYRGSNLHTGDEWIEVVLIQDLTDTELESFYIGDSTASTVAKFSAYQLTSMSSIATNFLQGTIIVIGGDSALTEDSSYDPTNGDWKIMLQTTGSHIIPNGSTGDLANTDVVYVDTSDTGSTISANGFAVNWHDSPGIFGANADVTVTIPSNNSGVVLNSGLPGATSNTNWSSSVASGSLTQGEPNGGDNTTYIQSLRNNFKNILFLPIIMKP